MFRMLFSLIFYCIVPCVLQCSPYNNKIHKQTTNSIKIVNVIVEHYSHEDFQRIAEYFNGGHEHYGHRCIVRTDPDVRTGEYFIVNFSKPLVDLPNDLTVNIYLMIGKSLNYEKYSFQLPNKRPNFVSDVYLGITSKCIDLAKVNAWKIEVINTQGEIITLHKSFMWPSEY